MYRRNKYGKNVEVEKGCCGSCANYRFEDEDDTNWCTHYGRYYPYDDTCKGYWIEATDVSGGGGCFLTTACCEYMGLPDNCYELQLMRQFRDEVLTKSYAGITLIKFYYDLAPHIVEAIEKSKKKEEILKWVYKEVVEICNLVECGKNDDALSRYVLLVYHAERKVV